MTLRLLAAALVAAGTAVLAESPGTVRPASAGASVTGPSATSASAAASRPASLRVGQKASEAKALLAQLGARDISAAVAARPKQPEGKAAEWAWYELPDKTCLCLGTERARSAAEDSATVASITVGERGKGYGDKTAWEAQIHFSAPELTLAAAAGSLPLWRPAGTPETIGEARKFVFDGNDSLAGWTVTDEVSVGLGKSREGKGGSLKIGPGGKALLKLRDKDELGRVELYVFDDGTKPEDPKAMRTGPRWGLVQSDGRVLVVGTIYAKYLAGDASYAASDSDGKVFTRALWYLGVQRAPAGWHKWTFDWDKDSGLRILHNDADVNRGTTKRFDPGRISLTGFSAIVVWGDGGKGDEQTIWVSDVTVTTARPATQPAK